MAWNLYRSKRSSASAIAEFSAPPVEPPPDPVAVAPSGASGFLPSQVSRMLRDIALSVPAVRRARNIICSTIAGWPLTGTDLQTGATVDVASDARLSWLLAPELDFIGLRTYQMTLDDLLFEDRAVWRIDDRFIGSALPAAVERIRPSRIDTVSDPFDPDKILEWIIDGHRVTRASLLVFDGGGLGGLARNGDVIDIAAKLLASAGRYASSPLPAQILRNTGKPIGEADVRKLLDVWQAARQESSVAYMNSAAQLEIPAGAWSAKELQLVEAREQAATEIARLVGLPAYALDATSGDSNTYGNRVDNRLDMLEALKPWRMILEQTLNQVQRGGSGRQSGVVIPRQLAVRFDSSDYARPAPLDRMQAWKLALESDIMTLDEIRLREPLTNPGGNSNA